MLFWDEQLSSDDSIACGTCHLSEFGGSDARIGRHPGADEILDTAEDVLGSPGVARADAGNELTTDELCGFAVQVIGRSTQAIVGTEQGSLQVSVGRSPRSASAPGGPSSAEGSPRR